MRRRCSRTLAEQTARYAPLFFASTALFGGSHAVAADLKLTASATASAGYTDNVAPGAVNQSSSWVYSLIPRIGLNGKAGGGRTQLYFDFQPQFLGYTSDASNGTTQNALGARMTMEAIDSFLFVDASARITQAGISAFGLQTIDNTAVSNNRAESRSLSIRPRIQWQGPYGIAYELGYGFLVSDTDSSAVGILRSSDLLARVSQANAFGPLGWTLEGLGVNQEGSGTGDYYVKRYRGVLTYRVDSTLDFFANLGHERNNFANDQSGMTYGAGLNWRPTERTNISGRYEERVFGPSYYVSFDHRWRRSSLNFTFDRGLQQVPRNLIGQLPPVGSTLPNLGNLGNQNFLTNQPLVSRSFSASYGLQGVRNSLSVRYSESSNQSATTTAQATGDFAQGNRVLTRNYNVGFNHSLSGFTSLYASINQARSKQEGTGSAVSDTMNYQLGVSSTLGAKTSANLNFTRSEYETPAGDSTSNGVNGSVSYTFF